MFVSKKAITKMQAIIIIVIIVAIGISGAVYYSTLTSVAEKNVLIFTKLTYIEANTDPHWVSSIDQLLLHVNVYESLFRIEGAVGESDAVPQLVDSYEVSPDGKTYTMHLVEGVKFHDGTELTSEDVVFSIDRYLRMGKGYAWFFDGILLPGGTEAVDKYTVVLHLENPCGLVPSLLCIYYILNKDLVMAHKETGEYGEYGDYGFKWLSEGHEAGSGPYILTEYDPREGMTLAKFDDFREGWKAEQFEEVVINIIPEGAAAKAALLKDEISIIDPELSVVSAKDLGKQEGITTYKDSMWWIILLMMNNQKPPTDDIHFRKACAWAFDYDEFNTNVWEGAQAQGPAPNTYPMHNDEVFVYHTDLEKAEEELAKSKYTIEEINGMGIKISYAAIEYHKAAAMILKSALEKLGINLELSMVAWPVFVEKCADPETAEAFSFAGMSARAANLDFFVKMYTDASWGSHYGCSFFNNETINETLFKAFTSVDRDEQEGYYKEAQEMLVENIPAVWIGNPYHFIAMRSYISGYTFPGGIGFDYYFYALTKKQ